MNLPLNRMQTEALSSPEIHFLLKDCITLGVKKTEIFGNNPFSADLFFQRPEQLYPRSRHPLSVYCRFFSVRNSIIFIKNRGNDRSARHHTAGNSVRSCESTSRTLFFYDIPNRRADSPTTVLSAKIHPADIPQHQSVQERH